MSSDRIVLDGRALLEKHGRAADSWLLENVPFFECPDPAIEELYYYRWWSFHKNIQWHAEFGGWTVHEGDGYGITPCPLGHHLYEGRWIKDRAYLRDYCRFWFTGRDNPRRYSTWFADGWHACYLVDGDAAQAVTLLEPLKVITGLAGLRPRADDTLEVNPLVPAGWDYFCVDGILYHGRMVTILYDRTGSRYHKGTGLRVLVDGVEAAHSPTLAKFTIPFESRKPPAPPETWPTPDT